MEEFQTPNKLMTNGTETNATEESENQAKSITEADATEQSENQTKPVTEQLENQAKPITERRPRKVIIPSREYDDQIVELLTKGFMEDPVSAQLWPDPGTRELGHRAMFYAHLANQRLDDASSSSSSSFPATSTFVNAVVDEDVNEDAVGVVRAVSIWTTPEGPKAMLNSLYYGLKYLGFFETMKWAKHFLRDFHQVVEEIFDEIKRIRRDKRRNKKAEIGNGETNGGGVSSAAVGLGVGSGVTSGAVAAVNLGDNGVEGDVNEEEECLAFPDFIAADSQIRGQGYGADVMRDALHRCKEAGATVFIISSNAKNLSFYQKFGFSVHVEKMFNNAKLFGLAPEKI